ncbi:tetratricopeptide repeat protein [Streptomyces sp. NPDC001508]|uniref:tetratricopeptide repeat protein n=1 Tax=Streptomyces sp. NPDC001508 TaxID=3154656 RepID=UPI003317A744
MNTRNNLATAYQEAGNLKRAIALYVATLAQCEQVFGEAHPLALDTRNALARVRQGARTVPQPDAASSATAFVVPRPSEVSRRPD